MSYCCSIARGRLAPPALLISLFLLQTAPPNTTAATWVSGITESINDVTLSTPLAGIVAKRPRKEGDRLRPGEAAVELDKRLEELEAERRKLALDLKKSDLESTRALFEKKALSISREEMDKKISEYNITAVEFELAKEQLRRRQIVAPFEGTIVEILIKEGEACQALQPLVRIVDAKRCYFIANVEAKSGHGLTVGKQVNLEIEAGNATVPFVGVISFVSPVVDPASGLLKVKITFENSDERIRPGVAGRMKLEDR